MDLFGHSIRLENGASLRDQIESTLEKEIRAGRWEVGTRLPPVRTLSLMTGLSVSPISDALATLARRGFLERHVGRGTFLLSTAPEQRQRHRVIAVTCDDARSKREFEVGEPFLDEMILRVTVQVQTRGFSSLVLREWSRGESRPSRSEETVSAQALGAVDGILNVGAVSESLYRLSKELRLPLVCLGHAYPPDDVSFVTGAELQRLWSAVDFLYAAGHRRIGLAHAFHGACTRTAHLLHESYLGALKELGIEPCQEWVVFVDTERLADLSRIHTYLTRSDHPTSVICLREESVHAIYNAASLTGIRIPDDVSVLGLVNKRRFGIEFSPPLSSLVMPLKDFAKRSVDVLTDLIEGKKQIENSEGILVRAIWKERGSILDLSGTSRPEKTPEERTQGSHTAIQAPSDRAAVRPVLAEVS